MEEGKVARWLVADGERVRAGQAIVEIEMDKAVAEIEAPLDGILRHAVSEGAVVPVHSVLAEILEGTDVHSTSRSG
jgi:pyruvate/2-oxoglutarate dehydrogenase complex dihydrolipoamide acyltransferase (E2) component